MPNRIIKDSICESRGLSEVSFFAADLYKRLITYADDYGRFNADFQIILARLYPREIGLVSLDDIEDAMTELAGVGKIAFYTSKGRDELYGCLPKWKDHQRVRDSKQKIPEPEDVSVNDWYLRRFIPLSLRVEIIERDQFTCQECGKMICPGIDSAKRLAKMGAGLFEIDHIVPVNQGGRATLENLRLLCPTCNARRRRHFTFEEIVAFSQEMGTGGGDSEKVAANCGELPPNPIQSNTNPNPNTNPTRAPARLKTREDEKDDGFQAFWSAYPKKNGGDIREAFMEYDHAVSSIDVSPEDLIKAAEDLAEATAPEEIRFLPNAAKWLRNRGWETKVAKAAPKSRYYTTAAEAKHNNKIDTGLLDAVKSAMQQEME